MAAGTFLRKHRNVRAVGQPFGMAHVGIDAADRKLLRLRRHVAALLVDADDERDGPVGRAARAVEEEPAAVGRPPRPAGLRATAEKADPTRLALLSIGRLQPDVIGLILVRMERDPLSVRRPAQRLVFRR